MAEKRQFKMHPDLLMSVISRQAGSLAKAVLEGCMNSADAGATQLLIAVTPESICLTDNGQGFRSREEIEQWFEVFGTPHSEEEQKVYGTFRMGRGQMFSYGVNFWQSGAFRMRVDFKNDGLAYLLEELEGVRTEGCAIQIMLYEALLPGQLAQLERDLERWVRYMPLKIYWNEKLISKDPAKEKWDQTTDEAYFRFQHNGSLGIYNLGAWVMESGGHRYGVAGEVVSKKALRVNFARNDVQSSCPVWRKIAAILSHEAGRVKTKQSVVKLTDSQRQYFIHQLLAGELNLTEARSLKLFQDATGQYWSLQSLTTRMGKQAQFAVTTAPLYDMRADHIMQAKRAFVFSEEGLEPFGMTFGELVGWLHTTELPAGNGGLYNDLIVHNLWNVVDLCQLAGDKGSFNKEFTDKDLSPNQLLLLEFLRSHQHHLADSWHRQRKLIAGDSENCYGWTDGVTMIAIRLSFLKTLEVSLRRWIEIGQLILHEYCHDGPSSASHVHSEEFYRAYHDAHDRLSAFVTGVVRDWPDFLAMKGKQLNKAALSLMDSMERGTRAAQRVGPEPTVILPL